MFAEGLLSLIRGQGGQMPDQYTQQAPGDLGGGLLDYSQPLQALPGTMAAILRAAAEDGPAQRTGLDVQDFKQLTNQRLAALDARLKVLEGV